MFYLAQTGSTLYMVQTDGTIVALTLPTGVTINSATRGQILSLAQKLFFVRAPNINVWLDPGDPDRTVRPMSIPPPIGPATVAAGAGTGLTGAYRVKVSFYLKNPAGQVVIESPLSGGSLAVTLANQDLDITNIPVCPNATRWVSAVSTWVIGRRLYRTAASGSVYYQMVDIDDNDTVEYLSTLGDSQLALLSSDPSLGNPPGTIPGTSFDLACVWNNRIWAKAAAIDRVDHLIYCEINQPWAWPATNDIPMKPAGEDAFGITGFLPRRDELGIAKRNRLLKIVGNSNDDFQCIIVAEGAGCIAPFSCVIIRDVGYYLGLDGVYEYGPDGVRNISNAKVAPWFLEDTVFNRAQFPNAVGGFNPKNNTYELQLANVGSSVLDRWVAFDLARREWLGPHKTDAFSPTARGLLRDVNGNYLPVMGSSGGNVYTLNSTTASDAGTAVSIDWITKWFSANAPDMYHFWDRATLFLKKQAAGTLTLTPRVGATDAANGTAQTVDMSAGDRKVLARWGAGRLLRLEFTHTADAQDVEIYGLEQPFTEVGRR